MMIHDEIFEKLHERKLCKNDYELSKRWFRCSQYYVGQLRAANRQPCMNELMTLHCTLKAHHQPDLAERVYDEMCAIAAQRMAVRRTRPRQAATLAGNFPRNLSKEDLSAWILEKFRTR